MPNELTKESPYIAYNIHATREAFNLNRTKEVTFEVNDQLSAQDIKQVTEYARRMVTQWGMSAELGPIRYSDDEQHVFLGNEITKAKMHSDRMAEQIDQEIRALLMGCYERAQTLCREHAASLERIAEALLELETLTGEDVDKLFQGATAADLVAERDQAEERDAAPEAEATERRRDEGSEPGGLPHPAHSPA